MNIIGTKKPIRATKARLELNDCPADCRKNHCDECPFRMKSGKNTKNYHAR